MDENGGKNDGRDEGVEPVAFAEEIDEGEDNAENGRENEREHANLDNAVRLARGEARENARKVGKGRTRGVEMGIVGLRLVAVLQEIKHQSYDSDEAGNGHAPTEGVADELLYVGTRIFHKKENVFESWKLEISLPAVVNHIAGNEHNHYGKNAAQESHVEPFEESCARHCACQNAE